jgi:hypothetical protein
VPAIPETFRTENPDAQIVSGNLYLGAPDNPQIGDERLSLTLTRPGEVTVMAVQSENTFRPYETENGKTRFLLAEEKLDAADMVAREEGRAKGLRWGLRAGGFILMAIGFGLILRPLAVMADIIPIFGGVVGFAATVISLLLSAIISLIVIAVSWVFVRPLLGISLLVIAFGIIFLVIKLLRKNSDPATQTA